MKMKKLILVLIVICLSGSISAQIVSHDSTKTEFKNAVGLDVTALLLQFTNNGSITNYYYQYPDIISYRRFIKSNALKVSLGGYVSNDNGLQNDTLSSKSNRYSVNLRAGYEHYCYLGKRWMYYFGADLLAGYTYTEYRYTWSTTSYRDEKTKINSFGISPVIGVTFKINQRLSIATQASYDVLYSEMASERINTPDNSMYDSKSINKRVNTQFVGPQFVNVRLKF